MRCCSSPPRRGRREHKQCPLSIVLPHGTPELGIEPKDAKDDCKCGDDAVTDEVLAQAMEATRIRDTQRNEARAAKDSKAACVARGRPHEDCSSEER